jgi:hypothetical protein
MIKIKQGTLMRILLLISIIVLSSCKATQNLSVYSFDDADIEALLRSELPQLSQRLSIMGLPVELEVGTVKVDIGPDNRDVVRVELGSTASIKALMLSYPVGLNLRVEGSPYYDADKQAIYLRNVDLLDSNVDAGGFRGNLNMLDKEVMVLVNGFLNQNPIYKLDPNDTKVRLMTKLGLDMKIEEGKIRIVPGN